MVAPALTIYCVFVLYPIGRGLYLSFTDFSGVGEAEWIGLNNYEEILDSAQVREAVRNTIRFTIIVVILQNAIALYLSAALFKLPRIRSLANFSLLLPTVMPIVIVGYVWAAIYSPLGGPLNELLEVLGLGGLKQIWLGDPDTALYSVAATNVWMFAGYSTIIYLANYLAIDGATFEAAKLDGASGLRRWWHLDRHLLAPAMTVNIALSTIGTLRIFELPFVMTGGGPVNATHTLTMVVYESGFGRFRYGFGTAVAVLLLVFTAVVSVFQVTLLRRREARL